MIKNQILKRILLFLLIITLMPTVQIVAKTEIVDENILENPNYAMLCNLGILEAEDIPYITSSVRRGDFVKMAVKIMGIDVSSYADDAQKNLPYTDVDSDREYIYAAYKSGLISAASDGKFRPFDRININELSKILTVALGYEVYASSHGGYPSGYLAAANRIDLFKGCAPSENGYISYRSVLRILRNALMAPLCDMQTITSENVATYAPDNSRTLFEEKFDIYYIKGVVTANPYTGLKYNKGIEKNRVRIGSTVFLDGYSVGEHLGETVEAYYKKTDKDVIGTVLYTEKSNTDEIWTIDARDINPSSTTIGKLSYYDENDKIREINIDVSASLIYNNKFEILTKERITPDIGGITLVDTNGDKKADTVRVIHYNTTIHSAGVSAGGTLADNNSGVKVELDKESRDYEYVILKDESKITPKEIMPDDVVLAAIPLTTDSFYLKSLLVTSGGEEGIISACDSAENKVWLNEKEFLVSSALSSRLTPGSEGMFYYDAFNRIVAYKEYETVVYGYLYRMASKGFDGVQARIFTENNRWVTVDIQKKLNYNGNKSFKAKDLLTDPKLFAGSTIKEQMIAYRMSKDGELSLLKTAEDDKASKLGEKSYLQNEEEFRLSRESATSTFRSYTNSFQELAYLGKTAKIFMIPSSGDIEEDIIVCNSGNMVGDRTYNDVKIYNMSPNGMTQLVTMQKNTDSAVGTGVIVVTKVLYATDNQNASEGYLIKGWNNGVEVSLRTADLSTTTDTPGFTCADLEFGDIIQYEIDKNANVRHIYLKYDKSATPRGIKGAYSRSNDQIYDNYNFLMGKVVSTDHSDAMFTVEYQTDTVTALSLGRGSTKFYLIDTEDETVTEVDRFSLIPGSNVLVAMTYMNPNAIYIYEN